jgi:murein peptide amidase A
VASAMSSFESSNRENATTAIQRLGRNAGRYLGETVQIESILAEVQTVALERGWTIECFLNSEEVCLHAYRRVGANARKRLYISAGIHGDEPAGPLAVLELLRQNQWPDALEVLICPCLNPTGFSLNSRESARGLDLNREYLQPSAPEILAHIAWLDRQPRFDATLCLHEDWESHGFYVYEVGLANQLTFAEEIIQRVTPLCPVDQSTLIEGREAHGGIIRPSLDPASRPQWPEAFYLITHKTPVSCTLEAPSDFPMHVRVAALVAGVRAVIDKLLAS